MSRDFRSFGLVLIAASVLGGCTLLEGHPDVGSEVTLVVSPATNQAEPATMLTQANLAELPLKVANAIRTAANGDPAIVEITDAEWRQTEDVLARLATQQGTSRGLYALDGAFFSLRTRTP